MDAFEDLVSLLLRREGYWTTTSFKVELSKEEKRAIERHSAPRWEIDVVAYRGATNEVLAIECKSFLDSAGVVFRSGQFEPPERYKLFSEPKAREVVLGRLGRQLVEAGACAARPSVRLCMATGNIAQRSDRGGLAAHFEKNGWRLFDDVWIREQLIKFADAGYENEVAMVTAKILTRRRAGE